MHIHLLGMAIRNETDHEKVISVHMSASSEIKCNIDAHTNYHNKHDQ